MLMGLNSSPNISNLLEKLQEEQSKQYWVFLPERIY